MYELVQDVCLALAHGCDPAQDCHCPDDLLILGEVCIFLQHGL